jgi:hypothetical protein
MYALVRNGVVTKTWAVLPSFIDYVSGPEYMTDDEKRALGLYVAVDQRPALPTPRHSYTGDTFTFDGSQVNWSATLVPPSADDQAALDAKAYSKLAALTTMTPAEVQTWVQNNVNTLAEAKDAIKTLAVAVSILARRL